MSRRNKLQKFAEMAEFENVYQNFDVSTPLLVTSGGREVALKGRWAEDHFGNNNPITLELGCGKGEYTVALAATFPARNFIGVDIKGARMWKGAKKALGQGLSNAAFLRTRIEFIESFFAKDEVVEIWITFPDPFPRDSKVNRRLTAPIFLERYRSFLISGGLIHLKTDDAGLYQFTLHTIAEDPRCTLEVSNKNIYGAPLDHPALGIKTFYEKMHLKEGKKVRYARFAVWQ